MSAFVIIITGGAGVLWLCWAGWADDPHKRTSRALVAIGWLLVCAISVAIVVEDDIISAIERRPVSAESAR